MTIYLQFTTYSLRPLFRKRLQPRNTSGSTVGEMASTDGEVSFANTIGRIAEDLDLVLGEALDRGSVEWISVGQDTLW